MVPCFRFAALRPAMISSPAGGAKQRRRGGSQVETRGAGEVETRGEGGRLAALRGISTHTSLKETEP
jgi:hypothetical protein